MTSRAKAFGAGMADYDDLTVGLHPDEAARAVAEAALARPTIIAPCCNFWSDDTLGRDGLIDAIERYYYGHGVAFGRAVLDFRGPNNIATVSNPPPIARS